MLRQEENRLVYSFDSEKLWIEPWGPNAFRVRATKSSTMPSDPRGLEPQAPPTPAPQIALPSDATGSATITNGNITATVSRHGKLTILDATGTVMLEEYSRNRRDIQDPKCSALEVSAREFKAAPGGDYHLTMRFESQDPNERILGMGQYQQPHLDLKGLDLELAQRNSQASVPFALSSRGYGLLWNNPAVGRAVFGKNVMSFEAYATDALDYWVVVGERPADIVRAYMDVTGKPPMMPEYGLGFWQCKLRYETQEEVLRVAREHKRLGLPMDVIVIDFFHWPMQGDWKFDSKFFPDPEAMVKELRSLGIELMVSIWPTVDKRSENYAEMLERGLLVRTERGLSTNLDFEGETVFYDATNPEARSYVWEKTKKNYFDYGIKAFWLDVAEPEYGTYDFDNYRYHAGPVLKVGNQYPRDYARTFYEGQEGEGQGNIVNLLRCAWVGSQKYGALVWSGDIASSWASLRNQLAAGLNMGIAGLPWWTTDIGGFHGGDPRDEGFRELFARWFQWGAFCPVMRLHGDREPKKGGALSAASGADNEVWSYGEEVFGICKKYMLIREGLREYTRALMDEAHKLGSPVMRPLFYEFPGDERAWAVHEEFMYGDRYLACPVLRAGVRRMSVYLPRLEAGERWASFYDEAVVFEGGQTVEVECALDSMPVFTRVSDVLTRHIASHIEEPPLSLAESGAVPTRACRECAASRVRCSRGDPCRRCHHRGLECRYPASRKRKVSSSDDGQAAVRPGELVSAWSEGNPATAAPNSAARLGSSTAVAAEQVPSWMLPQNGQPPTQEGFVLDGIQGPADGCHFVASPVPPLYEGAMSSINWLSPDDSMQLDWTNQVASFTDGVGGFDAFAFPFLADFGSPASAGPSWVAPAAASVASPPLERKPEIADALPPPSESQSSSHPATSPVNESGESTARSARAASEATFYADGDVQWRSPLTSRPPQPHPAPRLRRLISGGARSTSPSNGSGPQAEAVTSDTDAPSIQAYEAMLSRIRAEAPHMVGDGHGATVPTKFPSLDQIRAAFRLYFQCFHHTFPFLRRDPTFYESPSQWILLLAICAVGARYAPGDSDVRNFPVLFDVLERVLGHRAADFPFETPLLPWARPPDAGEDQDDPLSTLQAAVLNLIWKVHGGKSYAMRGAGIERHRMVEACRNLDLLAAAEPQTGRGREKEASGARDWLAVESRIRTGLMIWLLDSIFVFEIGSEPLLRLGDAKGPLPCREDLWDDARVGSTFPGSFKPPPTLLDAIEMLYIEKKIPPDLDDFGTVILIHAICRRTKEAVHHHQTTLATWSPTARTVPRTAPSSAPAAAEETWPPALPILSRWRNSACDCLDILHVSANSISASGWEHPAVFHLHLARLMILTPVAPLQVLAAAATVEPRQRGGAAGSAAAVARGQVLRWAVDDQYKARLAVIHAGSIFWHVRRYSADSFIEPFGVFLATLVLWAYSTSVQFASSRRRRGGRGVEDDEDDLEEEEDGAPRFFNIDRPMDDEVVQAFVRVGHKISGHLSRVGDICREGAGRKILRQGRQVLVARRKDRAGTGGADAGGGETSSHQKEEGPFVWGIAESFVETLECLIRSSGE
ncbi:related to alpha-glucosidase 2 [Cephalotrichum gorgonifer]|uniref:Related to alpha-glucosidase 2 n=1 Tax=Cephalotrichum gorgonifer TaxID=2041049 RepID=A0AAE8N7Y1_9PEZI|nr:related to alpha-glucosidase 2 [Cephalotrichum gorgonifer]